MVRDEKRRAQAKRFGRLGGNPKLISSHNQRDNPPDIVTLDYGYGSGISPRGESEGSADDGARTAAGPNPTNRLIRELGIGPDVGERQRGELTRLIAINGFDSAKQVCLRAMAKGVTARGLATYSEKILASDLAKAQIKAGAEVDLSGIKFDPEPEAK
jgi:hypothetical protein